MSKNTGGPAFPLTNDRAVAAISINESRGMTLRDYFAAKAMQGLIACGGVSDTTAKWIAEIAYCYADALIAEREE